MMTESPAKRSLGIDALRGLAVLMVVLHHAYVPQVGIFVYDVILDFFRRYGALGVDLFFVLSGFCIHYGHSKSKDAMPLRNYLLRRWWRIYPPYFFALVLAVALNCATNYIKFRTGGELTPANYDPVQILAHAGLVHNLSPYSELTISGPFWTIAMEAQYYLLYPLVRPFLFDRKGWIRIFVLAAILYLLAWRFQQEPWIVQPLSPFRYWIEWLFGAYVVYRIRKRQQAPVNVNKGRGWVWWAAGISCAAAAFLETASVRALDLTARVVYAFGFALLVWAAFEDLGPKASSVWKWLSRLGIFSYSVYLIHFLFLDRIRVFVVPEVPAGLPRLLVSVGSIAVCLGLAYAFYRLFEMPFLERASRVPK